MRRLVRVALSLALAGGAWGAALAPAAHASGGPAVYYVTERFNQGIAKVTVDSGNTTVDPNFVTGLPGGGPDSVIFDQQGNMLISNTDVGTISKVDTATGQILQAQVNNAWIPNVADLALDPTTDSVWAIGWSNATIARVSLATGDTAFMYPIGNLGGIASTGTGRIFVASHWGTIDEISPQDGHVLRAVSVPGGPDGMTFDPTTGHLFASGCGGICELSIGTDAQPSLALVRVHTAVDGDGIAADGQGHIIVTGGFCCLSRLDLATDTVTGITAGIPSADDVAPVVGAGAPPPPPPSTDTTSTAYTGPVSGDYDDPVTLSAQVLDTTTHQPLTNAPVQFTLGSQSCSGTTDGGGTASCSLTLTQAAGPYTVTAAYAGDATHSGSSASQPFTIRAEESALNYTGDTLIAAGQVANLSAILTEDGTAPVAGRTITFSLGTQTCSGVTDSSGRAACAISAVSAPLGPTTITVSFAGDSDYAPASITADGLVFAYLAQGAFVIGDRDAAVGTAITYWGAQWAKDNTLSGGTAPAAFKGFAESAAALRGQAWTTDPGNSSGRPAAVPAYMAVIVSSAVSQSGSTISGDTPEIVIVHTKSGYAADPGHAGTGTVVAVL